MPAVPRSPARIRPCYETTNRTVEIKCTNGATEKCEDRELFLWAYVGGKRRDNHHQRQPRERQPAREQQIPRDRWYEIQKCTPWSRLPSQAAQPRSQPSARKTTAKKAWPWAVHTREQRDEPSSLEGRVTQITTGADRWPTPSLHCCGMLGVTMYVQRAAVVGSAVGRRS